MSSITIIPRSYASTTSSNLPNINIPPMRPAYLNPKPAPRTIPPTYQHLNQQVQRKPALYGAGQRKPNFYNNNNYNNNIKNLPSLLDINPFHLPSEHNTRSFHHAQQYHPNQQHHQHLPRPTSRTRFHLLSQLPSQSRSRSRSPFRPPPIKPRRTYQQQQNNNNKNNYRRPPVPVPNINNNNNKFKGIILSDSMCSRVRTYALKNNYINIELSYESGCDIVKMINWLNTPEGRVQRKPALYGAGQRKYNNFHKFQTGTTTTFNGYTNYNGSNNINLPPTPAPRQYLPPTPFYNNNNRYQQQQNYHYNRYNNYRRPNFYNNNNYNNNIKNLPSLLDINPFHLPSEHNTRSFHHAQQYHPNQQHHQHLPRPTSRTRFHILSQLPSQSRSRSRSPFRPPPIKPRRIYQQQQQNNNNKNNYRRPPVPVPNINNNNNNFKGIILSDSMCSRVRTYALKNNYINIELSYESGCDIVKMINWLNTPEGRGTKLDFDIVDARLGPLDMRVEDGLHPSTTTGRWKYEEAIREWFSNRAAAHFSSSVSFQHHQQQQRPIVPTPTMLPSTPTPTYASPIVIIR
ncbi:unnamed protein product [Rotaria sp. Silwood1]|nr:unnamed protein product [Rotaria sp. Silwood1]